MSESKQSLDCYDGKILRSTSKRFQRDDFILIDEVGIVPANRAVRIRHQPKTGSEKSLEPVEPQEISALVIPAAGKERTEVLFRHPGDPRRLVGVVLDDLQPDDRGEVDGVWVAEEGGGIDPDL